jgi:hypothetical protein
MIHDTTRTNTKQQTLKTSVSLRVISWIVLASRTNIACFDLRALIMKNGLLLFALIFLRTIALGTEQPPVPAVSPTGSLPTVKTSSIPKSGIVLPPEKANPVRVGRFEKPPVIDGRLDDDAWKQAAVLKDFYQTQPGDNIPPSQATEVLIGYDAKTIYFAFRAHDEPGKVRATIPKRDQIFDDDYIGLYLDTFNDQRRAYIMFFNPLGVQADGIYTEGGGNNEDYSPDIVMESKGVVGDDGFTVEVAIPFKSLRYEAGKDKLWGVQIFRRIKRYNNELDSWMPNFRDRSGTLNQAGHITGLEGISTERTLEIIPSLTVSETGKRFHTIPQSTLDNNPALVDPGRFVNQPIAFDPGLTAKFGITPTVTLDLALNPDFAQVEADATVVTANQRFPIFFEEKRSFFLEGIDIFQTPLQILHTRTIIDPDVAVKLTGKRGRNTFGIMLASDNAPGSFSEDERTDPGNFPDIEPFLNKNAFIGVLRLKRDVGRESSIGFMATSYNFIQDHNYVAGFDGRFRVNPQTIFTFQALGTTTRRNFYEPERDEDVYRTGNAFAYFWMYDVTKRNYGWFVNGQGRTRDYRADVGFTRRVNTNRNEMFFRINNDPKPKAKLIQWRVQNFTALNYDWQGRSQNHFTETQLRLTFPRQTFLSLGFNLEYERLFEEEFGAKRTATQSGIFAGNDSERSAYKKNIFAYGETRPSKKYGLFVFVGYRWNEFDLDLGNGPKFPRVSPVALVDQDAPYDPGTGNYFELNLNGSYQPIDKMRFSLDYTKSRLVRDDTGLVAFDDNIISLRGTYQFTRFTFARARVDYDTLASSVRAQFLLGWAPNPGTAFYVGYNDDLNRNGFNPFSGQLEPGFRRNGRTFFIKMSYLFRRSF